VEKKELTAPFGLTLKEWDNVKATTAKLFTERQEESKKLRKSTIKKQQQISI